MLIYDMVLLRFGVVMSSICIYLSEPQTLDLQTKGQTYSTKHLHSSLFLTKLQARGLYWKETSAQIFFCGFVKFLSTLFMEHNDNCLGFYKLCKFCNNSLYNNNMGEDGAPLQLGMKSMGLQNLMFQKC